MTSLCIMCIFEIANFVAYDYKKLCCTCVIYDYSLGVSTFLRIISIALEITDIFEKVLCTVMS